MVESFLSPASWNDARSTLGVSLTSAAQPIAHPLVLRKGSHLRKKTSPERVRDLAPFAAVLRSSSVTHAHASLGSPAQSFYEDKGENILGSRSRHSLAGSQSRCAGPELLLPTR